MDNGLKLKIASKILAGLLANPTLIVSIGRPIDLDKLLSLALDITEELEAKIDTRYS